MDILIEDETAKKVRKNAKKELDTKRRIKEIVNNKMYLVTEYETTKSRRNIFSSISF